MDWAFTLCGRSGSGVDGLAPLSYPTIEAWARLSDVNVEPWEVEALVALDQAIRHPEEPEAESESEPENSPRRTAPAWPTRKSAQPEP